MLTVKLSTFPERLSLGSEAGTSLTSPPSSPASKYTDLSTGPLLLTRLSDDLIILGLDLQQVKLKSCRYLT